MAKMSGWICQDTYRERVSYLTDQELGRLTRAMMNYHIDGTMPENMGREIGAFWFIKTDTDSAESKYDSKCKQNRKNRISGTDNNDDEQTSSNVNDRRQTSTSDAHNKNKNINENINENMYDDEDEEVTHAREQLIDPNWEMVANAYMKQIGPLPFGNALETLISYVDDLHGEVVVKAIEVTNENAPEHPYKFLMAVLKEFSNHEIDSLQKAEAYLIERERRKANNAKRAEHSTGYAGRENGASAEHLSSSWRAALESTHI